MEVQVLDRESIDKLSGNMLIKLIMKLSEDKELVAKIKDNPKEVEQRLREVYIPMWRNNDELMKTPNAWVAMSKEFIVATNKWTAE